MNAQIDLFATPELEREGMWSQLPEASRQELGELFARLVLLCAAVKAESEARDEH